MSIRRPELLDVQPVSPTEALDAIEDIRHKLDRWSGNQDFYLTVDSIAAVLRYTPDAVGSAPILIVRDGLGIVGSSRCTSGPGSDPTRYFDRLSKSAKQNVRAEIYRLRRDGDFELALLSACCRESETLNERS